MKLKHKIIGLAAVAGLLVFAATILAATDFLRIGQGEKEPQTLQAADGITYRILNTTSQGRDYFVPNKSLAEWQAFKQAADTYLSTELEVISIK